MTELEPLVNVGVGGIMAAAAVYIIRWYANLASTGEETWSTRLDQLQEDFEKDRERFHSDRRRHDDQLAAQREAHNREMSEVREELEACRAECARTGEELARTTRELALLKSRLDGG